MSDINIEHFQKSFKEIYISLEKDSNEALNIYERFEYWKETVIIEILDECINRFVIAELDFETPGSRGIGRLSADIPRFGAYYRKGLSKLPFHYLFDVDKSITNLMIKGYLAHSLFMNEPRKNIYIESTEEFFRKWISQIYINSFSSFPEDVKKTILFCSENDINNLIQLLIKYRLRKRKLFILNKTYIILRNYVKAGFILRNIEISFKT